MEASPFVIPPSPAHFFENRFGMTPPQMEQLMASLWTPNTDYLDLFFEYTLLEQIHLEEGSVKQATYQIAQGVGIRFLVGEQTGYAYTEAITPQRILEAGKSARAMAGGGGAAAGIRLQPFQAPQVQRYVIRNPAVTLPIQAKIRFLEKVDRVAREYDPRIRNVLATFTCTYRILLLINSEGLVTGDIQPLCRLRVICIAEDRSGRRQNGTSGGGGRLPFEEFFQHNRHLQFAREAARQAIVNLQAEEAPAGEMEVVLGPGWPGILLHEAVGHGLEADFVRRRTSAFTDRIGERVASPLCTVVDDGTLPGRRGSLNIDDEGVVPQRTVLIERGILRGYLTDRLNARLLRLPLTGNGRRESYAHYPMPRMTNTFLLPGQTPPEEIIRSVRKGLYAVSFGGGQVDITRGMFVFSANEAYWIEDGKVTRPVRGATLIGDGPGILHRITMVGNDLELDPGIGSCGKDGQSVPVGVGLPTLKISGITVGGTTVSISEGGV